MAHRWKNTLSERDVTPEQIYFNRRNVIGAAAAGFALAGSAGSAAVEEDLVPNEWEHITGYNNFYEFGTDKTDPARHAHRLTTSPWSVRIDGLVERPADYALEDILSKMTVEERIYRLRCVERWAMVVPWNGFELADLLDLAGPQPSAKYVAFETALRPDEMPGVRYPVIEWPYVEGLRMDEATHPLTIVATGIYGKDMPNQNGAPLRIVVPWKYGYKSIKSIVRITLTDSQPPTAWNKAAPNEYGFYSNVNPDVDHPRWSQSHETLVGQGLLAPKIPTRMFNGYADDVAHLYAGMDLAKFH